MSSFDNETKFRIREASDIVQVIGEVVELKKKGARFFGLCPFHEEKTPSFNVNPSGQFFHCFGCGEGGDVFSFYEKYHRMSFREALEELGNMCGIVPHMTPAQKERLKLEDKLFSANIRANFYFIEQLYSNSKAMQYLLNRGIDEDAIRRWELGFAPDSWVGLLNEFEKRQYDIKNGLEAGLFVNGERGPRDFFKNKIMFPIRNERGKIVGFGGRVLDDSKPKYLNTSETIIYDKSQILYGLDMALEEIKSNKQKKIYIVEGYFDVITLHEAGIKNVVATCGSAFTREHLLKLGKYVEEIVFCFDGDEKGIESAIKYGKEAMNEGIPISIVGFEPGEDPDSYVQKYGVENFRELKEHSLLDFIFEYGNFEVSSNPDKTTNRVINDLFPIVDCAISVQQRSLWLSGIAEKIGVKPEATHSDYSFYMQRNLKSETESQIENQFFSFLAMYPAHRNVASRVYNPEDFSSEFYGHFFNFLCRTENEENLLTSTNGNYTCNTPLFGNASRSNLIHSFKKYLEVRDIVINQFQLDSLEGILTGKVNVDVSIIDDMRLEVLSNRLKGMETELLEYGPVINDEYFEKAEMYESTLQQFQVLKRQLGVNGV